MASTSLLNCNYKLFSSCLVDRLPVIMHLIVHPTQMYSVPVQIIFSSLSLTRDLFGFATRIGLKGPFVGLDQAKVFDLFEQDYLLFLFFC